ncbi:GNAT family N-acetyltransferase [Paracoccus sediminis]|uniref:Acetyltransferase (GNAT) family protein n=1 Tax=Paracoccus sediminis TaxID=1214787 RepID=A0A238W2E2_9RHOB|nr:GNAT family N-acetyltransferase [Paracoccus sediminis]TBN51697.1 GNAT family N-acetyltransferase [Paracoccus sediminis]SNR40755.1 Acetyltransferase (GNAT) family protein [Paracoccus sediminis]
MDAALAQAFENTWPAAEYATAGGFRVGRGLGAGGRVSSARAVGAWTADDIPAVETIHRAWDQPPMFRVLDSDPDLADALLAAGYRRETPTAILAAPIAELTGQPIPPVTTFAIWPPLAIQRDIWVAGNITPARQAVMDRARGPKTAILGRIDDRAAGAAFAAISGDAVMVHAVEVLPPFRRRGLAGWMARQAALWAAEQGATRIGLAVSRANTGARATWDRLGLSEIAGYGYYAKPS